MLALQNFSTLGVYIPQGSAEEYIAMETHLKGVLPDGTSLEWFLQEADLLMFLDHLGMETTEFYDSIPLEWMDENMDKAVVLGLMGKEGIIEDPRFEPYLIIKWSKHMTEEQRELANDLANAIMKEYPKSQAVVTRLSERRH